MMPISFGLGIMRFWGGFARRSQSNHLFTLLPFRSGHSHNVLTEAVYSYMQDAGEGHHEDYMRAFFRLKAQDLGAILPRINDIIKRSSHEVTQSLSTNLPQANDAVLVSLSQLLRNNT